MSQREQAREAHERPPLDQDDVLRGNPVCGGSRGRGRGGDWCLERWRGIDLAVVCPVRLCQLALYQRCRPLVEASGDPMLASPGRRFGEILAGALPVHQMIDELAARL